MNEELDRCFRESARLPIRRSFRISARDFARRTLEPAAIPVMEDAIDDFVYRDRILMRLARDFAAVGGLTSVREV